MALAEAARALRVRRGDAPDGGRGLAARSDRAPDRLDGAAWALALAADATVAECVAAAAAEPVGLAGFPVLPAGG